MATTIIIGSGGAHNAITEANSAAGANSWTQAQIDWMSSYFENFANTVEAKITYFQRRQSSVTWAPYSPSRSLRFWHS